MQLALSSAHEAFRTEVRTWVTSALPPTLRQKAEHGAHFSFADSHAWHRILHQKGWIAPHWPKAFGGTGWDVMQRHLFLDELATAGTPGLMPFGLNMLGPLLMQFGSKEQQARYLPKILSGDEVWCQGYSEPNAGSDLASLQLKAESDGDHYVLNGQKTWTTHADNADWIFCLVRTSSGSNKQQGITFLLVDLKTPGVEVRPFMNISGERSFSETFFTDVRVPKSQRVGEEGQGWTLAKALLGHERTMLSYVPETRRVIRLVKRIAAETQAGGSRLIERSDVRRRIAALEIRHRAIEMMLLRTLADAQAGRAPGPESSLLKIRGSELLQEAEALTLDCMGPNALGWFTSGDVAMPRHEQWVGSRFAYHRAASIYGGSNEIQRNIIAKRILGLPGAGA